MNFIPALLLALVLLCLCCFLGGGALILLYHVRELAAKKCRKGASLQRVDKAQRLSGADALPAGELILTGLAVTAHLAAVFTGQSFSRCRILFSGILGAALFFAAGMWFFCLVKAFMEKKHKNEKGIKKPDRVERILMGIFLMLALAQLVYLLWNAGIYTRGDMTVETVGSFLRTDSVYGVNPMTGQAYTAGIPSRLKILCLPTLYGFISSLSGLAPDIVVTAAVPAWIFVSSYAAFFCVGQSLFPGSRKQRSCFMITVVALIWAGSRLYGMDGFNLLYCGYRGVTIRNLVILPYLISLCLRRRWKLGVLCVLAEACIVWTFYGLGVCVLTAAGLFLAERGRRDGGAS